MLNKTVFYLLLFVSLPIALSFVVVASDTANAAEVNTEFAPSSIPKAVHVVRKEKGMISHIMWRTKDQHVRVTQLIDVDPEPERIVLDQTKSLIVGSGTPSSLSNVTINMNSALVAPDGYSLIDSELMNYVWPFIAQVRNGNTTLVNGGKGLLKGSMPLSANECAGLKKGKRTIFIDAKTFLPVRMVETRSDKYGNIDMRYKRAMPTAKDFSALKIRGKKTHQDEHYMRMSPQKAAKALGFEVSLPQVLPLGFKLTNSGSASLGGNIGPEASFPRSNGLFFARWNRGLEAINFTIRGDSETLAKDWDEIDPFAGECTSPNYEKTLDINGIEAQYVIPEDGNARLWWRNGKVLYSLSGPFSGEQFAEIARSLHSVL